VGQLTTLVSPIAPGCTGTIQDRTCDALSAVIQCAVYRHARHAKAAGTYIVHDPLQVDSRDQRIFIFLGYPKNIGNLWSLNDYGRFQNTYLKMYICKVLGTPINMFAPL